MNAMSAGATVQVFDAKSPLWADISAGYAYAVVLVNQTGADIVDGDFTIQTAPADDADRCSPEASAWADVSVLPQCDDLPGTVAAPAKIVLSAQAPLKAHSQCAYAIPCIQQFVRVVQSVTGGVGVGIYVVVTRLRRITY